MRSLPAAVASLVALAVAPGAAAAQEPPKLRAPAAVGLGGRLEVRVERLALPAQIEVREGDGWRPVGRAIRRRPARARLRAPGEPALLRLRARGAHGTVTRARRVRVRALRLAAVGDVNLGDGPGTLIARHGGGYPWASVGRTLRRADLSFANLECAISTRGTPQDKQYVFRGAPSSLAAMRRHAGIDVVNLANNHAGDYGDTALLDTLRHVRANGMTPVGAGADESSAYRPRIVRRLGLKIAFVGFSTILPFEFRAIGASPGTAWGFPERVRAEVARARRDADVVIATFHWGMERDTREDARERALAQVAFDAGATAVIGAHPHVLQPIRRLAGRRLVAYSLGNFVFSAGSPGTTATGILRLSLGRRGVVGSRFTRATIQNSRPILNRR